MLDTVANSDLTHANKGSSSGRERRHTNTAVPQRPDLHRVTFTWRATQGTETAAKLDPVPYPHQCWPLSRQLILNRFSQTCEVFLFASLLVFFLFVCLLKFKVGLDLLFS